MSSYSVAVPNHIPHPVDGPVVAFLLRVIDMSFDIVVRLVAVVVISPVFVFPGIMVGVVMAFVGQLYMKAQLAIKRERSNARSPVLGHFGAAIAGLGAATSVQWTGRDAYYVISVHPGLRCASRVQKRVVRAHRPVHPGYRQLLQLEQVCTPAVIL